MIEARSEHARFLPRLPFETLPPSSLRNGARAVSGAVKHANLRVPTIPDKASPFRDDVGGDSFSWFRLASHRRATNQNGLERRLYQNA